MKITSASRIAGIGVHLPSQIVSSTSLMEEIGSDRFGVPSDFITNRVGIRDRRFAGSSVLRSDMAISAAEDALLDAGVDSRDIDAIIYCGIEGDWHEPGTAHVVQSAIGASRASCLDISNACHGFLDGLALADNYIALSCASNVLVCTGEKPSVVVKEMMGKLRAATTKHDFRRWVGFLTPGDAGGAMVVQRGTSDSGWRYLNVVSEGENTQLCYYRRAEEGLDGQMIMKGVSEKMVEIHRSMMPVTYRQLGWQPEQVDRMFCHQVGAKPHGQLADLAEVPMSKVPITYADYGNLTTATVPVAMALNRPDRGDKVLFLVAGGGFTVSQGGMIF